MRKMVLKDLGSQMDWRTAYYCCQHIMAMPFPAPTGNLKRQGGVVFCEECFKKWLEAGMPDQPWTVKGLGFAEEGKQ